MITRQQAALTAELILEYPASDPAHGWQLDAFAHGWLVNWHDRDPAQFSLVIERETGLARYFTGTPPQRILNEYPAVREQGHPDHRWTAPQLHAAPAATTRPHTQRNSTAQADEPTT